MSQGPAVGTTDHVEIAATPDKNVEEQKETSTAGNAEMNSNTAVAMKQAGTEAKGSMKTSEMFLQQQLSEQLGRNVHQFGSSANVAGGGTANATTTADPSMEKARKEGQMWMDHGNKMLKEHRYNEALEAYNEGFLVYPHPSFLLNKASTLLDAGRYSEAVQAYERYLSDPDAPRADEAKAAMERAKAAMGGREATATGVAESRTEFEKGAEAFKAGRYQEAHDAFEKAYELNPLADFKFNQASALEKLGRPYAAADSLQAYLAAKPGAKDKAEVTARMNKLRTEADKAPITATGREGAQEWMSRGNRHLFAHRYNEAVLAYDKAYAMYPSPKITLNKAAALLDGGRYSEAVKEYEKYLSQPDAPRADEARAAMERAKVGVNKEKSRDEYDKGAIAYKEGRYQEAHDAFEKAYELNPLPDFKYNMGASLEKLGRPYAAANHYSEYAKEKPNAADARKVAAQAEKLRNEADKAPITATGREGAQEWMSRGNRHLMAHRYNEAVLAFDKGYAMYPSPKITLNKAAALLDGGRYSEAVKEYEKYLSQPDAPRADEARAAMERAKVGVNKEKSRDEYDKGAIAYKEGRYQEAHDAFEKAYELNPLPDFKYNMGASLEKLGRPYAAANRYSEYAKEKPNAPDARKVAAQAEKLNNEADKAPITASGHAGGQEWMFRGNRHLHAHRYNEAVSAYEEGFRTYPDSKFIMNKGSALLDAGRYAEADLTYQTYLSNPNAERADEVREAQKRARAHMGGREATITGVVESEKSFAQGNDFYKAGKYSEALQAYDRAYAQNPLADLRYNQAAALDKMGKRELAAQRYEAYLSEKPNAPDAAQVKAHITKLRSDALKAAQSAFDRGQEAFKAGRYNEAVAAFSEAYEQKPFPQFLYNVAASHDMAGDKMRAIQNYQLYLSMYPEANDAAKVRTRIHNLHKANGSELMQPGD
jgi:tetratricopeptide (TPR) repeat protein